MYVKLINHYLNYVIYHFTHIFVPVLACLNPQTFDGTILEHDGHLELGSTVTYTCSDGKMFNGEPELVRSHVCTVITKDDDIHYRAADWVGLEDMSTIGKLY